MRFLTTAEIIELHRRVVAQTGGASGIRDMGALESSIGQPFQTYAGEELYDSFIAKVAALAFFLVRNHPFVDGNKRIGHAALETTLVLNGLELAADVDEQEKVFLKLADGSLSREDFTAWANRHLARLTNDPRAIHDFPHIYARMSRARATHIRSLRVDQSYSWRVVAAECHEQWGDDAAWDAPSNVLAGMELCDAAAAFFGEHFLAPPWN